MPATQLLGAQKTARAPSSSDDDVTKLFFLTPRQPKTSFALMQTPSCPAQAQLYQKLAARAGEAATKRLPYLGPEPL